MTAKDLDAIEDDMWSINLSDMGYDPTNRIVTRLVRRDLPALIARVRELEAVINGTVTSMRNIGLDTSADVLEMALTKGATK